MPKNNHSENRRNVLKTFGAIGVSAALVPVVGAAGNGDSEPKVVEMDTTGFEHVANGVANFYESGVQVVKLNGVTDTTAREEAPSYRVAIENPTNLKNASAQLQQVTTENHAHQHDSSNKGQNVETQSGRKDGKGSSSSGGGSGSIGTQDHTGKDNTTDYEGGARISTGPSHDRTCETKQFVEWTNSNGEVDWAWRGWCAWSNIGWNTDSAGFADSSFAGDEYYTKSYGDYSKDGDDDKIYHRVKLWCEPDGQMRWEVVMTVHNDEGTEGYGHTADFYYTRDPYDNC